MYATMARSKKSPVETASVEPGRDSEAAFLADYDVSKFERPSVAVDVVVMTASGGALKALVYKRAEHPHRGRYALPGGFIRMDESLEQAARRLLRDKAGLSDVFIEQLYTFGDVRRDPRARVLSVSYVALVHAEKLANHAPKDVVVAELVVPFAGETGGPVEGHTASGELLPLAFDHALILGMAVKRLRGKLDYTPVGFQLLPDEFRLRDLQDVHETIRGEPVNKDSFRRRMLASGLIEATGAREADVSNRPAELYRFIKRSAT